MKHINDLIKQYGTQQKLADVMGVSQSQVSRWAKLRAYVSDTGEVYTISSRVNPV